MSGNQHNDIDQMLRALDMTAGLVEAEPAPRQNTYGMRKAERQRAITKERREQSLEGYRRALHRELHM